MTSTLTATLQDCEFLFDGIRRIWLTLPENSNFTYKAGQYVYLMLANGEERPYSIANAPQKNILEFHIHHHPHADDFTHELFNELLATKTVRLRGAEGHCFYHVPAHEKWILLAGGTGLAPCKAIIEAAIEHQHTKPIHLYWGTRTADHLYLHEQLSQWQQQYAWFKYTPVLFSPAEIHSHFTHGMVHEALLKDYNNLNELFVYAAGPAAMVFSSQEHLLRHGLLAKQFCSDYS
jgi:NAD(P)H-flavin reductase